MAEAVVIPLADPEPSAESEVAVALVAGAAAAEAATARDDAAEAQAEAIAANEGEARLAARVDAIGDDLLRLSHQVVESQTMFSEMMSALTDAIASVPDEAELGEPAIVPIADEPPEAPTESSPAQEPEAGSQDSALRSATEPEAKEEVTHHAKPKKRYGFRK